MGGLPGDGDTQRAVGKGLDMHDAKRPVPSEAYKAHIWEAFRWLLNKRHSAFFELEDMSEIECNEINCYLEQWLAEQETVPF